MKKIAAFLTGAVMAFGSIPFVSYAEEPAPVIWDGTADIDWYGYGDVHEYHITTAEQLAGLAALVNNGGGMGGETFYLDNDIYLNDISNYDNWETEPPANEWVGIGATGTFSGTFYGKGHTIYGMYQNKKGTGDMEDSDNIYCCGLFGRVNKGLISDLNCFDSYIKCSDYKGVAIGGIFGGSSDSKLLYCTFKGKIISENNYSSNLGGIAGWASRNNTNSLIYRCCNYGSINNICGPIGLQYRTHAGGIVGENDAKIQECYNFGNITAQGTGICLGGIIGYVDGNPPTVIACVNCADITSIPYHNDETKNMTSYYSGGIVGYVYNFFGGMYNCFNIGNISYICNVEEDIEKLHNGGLVGDYSRVTKRITNSYFLFGTAEKGFGFGRDDGVTYFRSEKNMKSPEFLELIGDKFIYVEGDFPQLKWTVQPSGDANMDGDTTVADLVMLQKFLLKQDKTLTDHYEADLCKDGTIDVYDLVALRKLIVTIKMREEAEAEAAAKVEEELNDLPEQIIK